jgi:hypothetical protein
MTSATEASGLKTDASRRGRRRAAFISTVAVVIGVGVGSFVLGVYLTSKDVANLRLVLGATQAETQKAKQGLVSQAAANSALQSRLAAVSAELEAIRPAKNTYVVAPNQSIALADGRLTIGLVGSPGSDSLLLNINGEQRKTSPGDVIQIPAGNDTSCKIVVQQFDMFKAQVNVNCSRSS